MASSETSGRVGLVKRNEETEWNKNKQLTSKKWSTVPVEMLLTINIISRTRVIATITIKLIIKVMIIVVTTVRNRSINWNNANNTNNNDSNDKSNKNISNNNRSKNNDNNINNKVGREIKAKIK